MRGTSCFQVAFKKAKDEIACQSDFILELQNSVESHQKTIENIERKLREEETTRRKLHNAVQELKGNIRVFCRVRPSLPSEANVPLTKMEFENDTNVMLCQTNGNEVKE